MSINALVCGFGSVGIRHADNLKTLSHTVNVYDISEEARKKSVELGYKTYSTLKEALDQLPEVVLICSSTESHIPIVQEVLVHDNPNLKGLFLEKPISWNMNGISTLVNMCIEKNIKLMTASNLRFDNGISLIKTLLTDNSIGNIYSVNYQYGYNLSKWHPDSDYTKSYSAGKTGGAILEDIHSIDLMLYLFDGFKDCVGKLYKSDSLAIQNESIFEGILTTENNVSIHIHSDLLNPYRTRILEIFGETGQIQYDFFDAKVYLRTTNIEETRVFSVCDDINFMYQKEIEYFINTIKQDTVPMNGGIKALEIVMNIKKQNSI